MTKKFYSNIITLLIIIAIFLLAEYVIGYYHNRRILSSSMIKGQNSHGVLKGYGLKLTTKGNIPVKDKNIIINDGEKFDYVLEVFNNTDKDDTLEVLLSINYTQVPFFLNKSNNSRLFSYEFTLNKGSKVDLPIEIDNSKFPYKINPLVFTIRSTLNKSKADFFDSSFSSRYNILTDKNSNLQLNNDIMFKYEKMKESEVKFKGLWLNNSFNKINEYIYNEKIIKVKADDYVKLALRTYSYTEDALFWMLIDDKRAEFKDSLNYIYFQNVKNSLIYKEVCFKAPSKKGTYKILGFIASNPIEYINTNNLEDYLIKASNKMFIRVE
ncbi:hypothetical protein DFR58_104122 [Anaerobacterium chartisolvens]|uniref:Uncharacterized protein n=1 Tax=Anaerobacterium chartisolvens TaxID=1297424 RepID=A0A369BBE7_9FIRM|nr:hypothetical protein [Anaerobacterium chartisolvens]RCX18853.1 hypothetical protein DFR58_104122 [Anaerobacterium chartisolvens]